MTEDGRLSRIEGKLDKLTEAMTSLVRMEERVVTIFSRLDVGDKQRADLIERVLKLEKQSTSSAAIIGAIERLFWITVTAAVAFVFAKLKGHI